MSAGEAGSRVVASLFSRRFRCGAFSALLGVFGFTFFLHIFCFWALATPPVLRRTAVLVSPGFKVNFCVRLARASFLGVGWMLRVLSSDIVSVIDSFLWFSTFLFVKGSRRRLSISSLCVGPNCLSPYAVTKFHLVVQNCLFVLNTIFPCILNCLN